ncbi:S-layer homology domain-containing protein [Brevibacillus choshinensis]|uniref:S-layer homology domain-containing protein n=1 Tax=Brevibacillus choshinensis TaxID=54911 RepID=UPI002E217824
MQDSGFKKKDRLTKNIPQEQFVYTRGGEHKVMKKVVNSVLASALALTVAPMAFAAEATTTEAPKMDAAMEKTVKRLEALGLVAGYGNGDYGVEKTITRAEFATLIVRARGLEQGAKLAQFNTTYTDVKSTDWFAGFVNVASGEEIVKGFPDKSFKPQNQVTYAEAVTMIVRALGYEPSVKGVWPNSMISKGSELNIAKGINNPNNAAVRGDIFKMLDNALRVDLMEQVEYGTDIRFNVTDETLLTKYLDVTVRDMEWAHDSDNDSDDLPVVSNVPAIGLGKIKANEVTLNGKNAGLGNTTYKVTDGINPNEFAGQHVQVWIKDDKENVIVWMEGSEDEEVVMDRTDIFQLNNKTVSNGDGLKGKSDLEDLKIQLDSSGKSYRFSEDVSVTYNFQRMDAIDGLKDIIKIAQDYAISVKLVLNDDNEVVYIHAIDDQSFDQTGKGIKYGSEVIEKIDADKKKIENLDGRKFSDLDDLDEGTDFLVFLDGKPAKLSDLKPMDVYSVYYADGDDEKLLVFANRTVVEGKVDKVVTRNAQDVRLTIGDKTYRARTGTSYSDNANKDVKEIDANNWDLLDDLDGEDVKLYLDASGRIRHVETKDSVDDRKLKAIVTRAAVYSASDDEYAFVVMTEKGKKMSISLEKDDIEDTDGVDFGDEDKNEDDLLDILSPKKDDSLVLLEVTLDSKGEPSKVKMVDTTDADLFKHANGTTWDNIADEDDNVVGDAEVTDDTAIFDMTGTLDDTAKRPELKDAGIAKFKDIADENDLDVYYLLDKDGEEVEAIFVVEGSGLSGDSQFGYVMNYGSVGGADSIVVLTKDENGAVAQKEYKLDDEKENLIDDGIRRGDFIAFSLNADDEVEVDDVAELVNRADNFHNTSADDKDRAHLALSQDKWDKFNIDDLRVAQVKDVDGSTITTTSGKKLYTQSSTAFIDAWDDLTGIDGVEDGDLIVLLDSDDDGSRYDYVLVVATEDSLDEEDISKDDIKAFLDQTPGNGDGGEPTGWDAVDNTTGSKFSIGTAVTLYSATVDLKVPASEVESAVLTVNGKDFEGKVEGDTITFEFSADFNAASGKLVVTSTDADNDDDTATVTFEAK